MIPTSNVAHTMQNWHEFCKWNKLLYIDMLETCLIDLDGPRLIHLRVDMSWKLLLLTFSSSH
jgi:hypothetical protein